MSARVPESFCARSNRARRSSGVCFVRGSATTWSGVEYTAVSLVIRTVYVPGRTRGPKAAPNAALAAGGTRGALRRIDQVTRLNPRRLLVGTVPSTRPSGPSTSIFMSPKMWRFFR